LVYKDGTGRPTHCPEPVECSGTWRLAGGKRFPVWSCDGYREGVEEAKRMEGVI
jgi:hypothetical protein